MNKKNVFITGIPESYKRDNDEEEITDQKVIVEAVFTLVNNKVTNDKYEVVKVFEPVENGSRYSAKVVFDDFKSKMEIIKNCKKLNQLPEENPLRKVRVRFDDPPLTRKENKRLSDECYRLKREAEETGSGDVYKLSKGKLLKNDVQIDEFNLSNQIFA